MADGRRLAYRQYGDPDGRPVLYCHGGLSSGLDAASVADVCTELGIRLVAPDRPGIGRSDYQPGRTLLDWPGDVRTLADALDLGRFAVAGWSAGGPYAVVCAYALGDRVTGGALLGSAVPFEAIGTRAGLNRPDRVLLALAERAPPLCRLMLWLSIAVPNDRMLRWSIGAGLADPDRAALAAAPSAAEAVAFMRESILRGSWGVVQDYRVFGAPWGFDLKEVDVPLHLWEGGEDRLAPLSWSELLAGALPRAGLTVVPGEGHLSLLRNRAKEILSDLLDRP